MRSSGLVYDPFSNLELARRINREQVERVGIRPGDAVLDIGCGPGDSTEAILECLWDGERYHGRVFAFDVDATAVGMARERLAGKPVTVMQCSAADLDRFCLGDGEFDAAVFANGAHYLRDAGELKSALQAIRRVTSGTFALWSAFTREAYEGNSTGRFGGLWLAEAYRILAERGWGDVRRNRTRAENLQDRGREEYVPALIEAGFRDIQVGLTPYLFVPETYEAIARFADYVRNALPSDGVPLEERGNALFAAVRPAFAKLRVTGINRNYLFVKGSAA